MALYVKERAKSRANNREEREHSEKREQSKTSVKSKKKKTEKMGKKAPRHRGLNASTAASASAGGTFEFLSDVKANACVLCTCIRVSIFGDPDCDAEIFKSVQNWINPANIQRASERVWKMMNQQRSRSYKRTGR